MNILLKRHYKLIIVFFLIILLSLIFSQTRIISYNFWTHNSQLQIESNTYTGSVDILQDSLVHEISLDITDEQYDYMMTSFTNNKEKEYVKIDITIDWTTIKDVWIRFKWNVDLLEILTSDDDFIQPALLIRFDEYIEWQTYEGLSELALRVDSDDTLLSQLVSYKLFQDIWLYSPSSWYANVEFWEKWNYLYIVSQVINQDYIDQNFENTSWVLYKALNSLSFSYLWEDPTLYTDLFEQETSINDDDMTKLITLLKFVSESTDEEFAQNLEDYIDIESYVWMLVMDEILWNHDILLWLLNNYYIYFDNDTWKASFITRDQKLSFWNIWSSLEKVLLKYYWVNNLDDITESDIVWLLKFTRHWVEKEDLNTQSSNIYSNDLKVKFLQNETFRELYNQTLEEYRQKIFTQGLANDTLEYFKQVFLSYSNYSQFISNYDFDISVTQIGDYIENVLSNPNIFQRQIWIQKWDFSWEKRPKQ